MAKKNKSGYSILYKFEYKGHEEDFDYDIPFETFMKGVVKYFDDNMVTIDGKDTDVWNSLVALEGGSDFLYEIFYTMKDWFKENCKEDAYEEYKEYIDWYYDEEEEEQ